MGTRLIGAFIAMFGLPQFNPLNEELRRRLDATIGDGHNYVYLFPGIHKLDDRGSASAMLMSLSVSSAQGPSR